MKITWIDANGKKQVYSMHAIHKTEANTMCAMLKKIHFQTQNNSTHENNKKSEVSSMNDDD